MNRVIVINPDGGFTLEGIKRLSGKKSVRDDKN